MRQSYYCSGSYPLCLHHRCIHQTQHVVYRIALAHQYFKWKRADWIDFALSYPHLWQPPCTHTDLMYVFHCVLCFSVSIVIMLYCITIHSVISKSPKYIILFESSPNLRDINIHIKEVNEFELLFLKEFVWLLCFYSICIEIY